jgi:hypothetical protein
MYYFVKENPPGLFPKLNRFYGYLIQVFIYTLVSAESVIMFWVTFFITSYWFIMYKLQDNAYILLPSVDKENSFTNETTSAYVFFYAFFLTILVCANLTVLLKIIE